MQKGMGSPKIHIPFGEEVGNMIKITHLEKHNEDSVAMSVFNHLKMTMPTTYFEIKISDGNSNLKTLKHKPSVIHEYKKYFQDPHNHSAEISRDDFYQLIEEMQNGHR